MNMPTITNRTPYYRNPPNLPYLEEGGRGGGGGHVRVQGRYDARWDGVQGLCNGGEGYGSGMKEYGTHRLFAFISSK